MDNDFKGRNAIITGGGSGIGFEIAKQLLIGNIDNVVLIGRNAEKLEKAKFNLGSKYEEKIRTLSLKDCIAFFTMKKCIFRHIRIFMPMKVI